MNTYLSRTGRLHTSEQTITREDNGKTYQVTAPLKTKVTDLFPHMSRRERRALVRNQVKAEAKQRKEEKSQ